MNDKVPPAARRAGFASQLGLDRNPLRRRTDWLESAIVAGLLAVFLAGAPLAAIGATGWTHSAGLREQRAQRSWRQVSMVLLQAAPRQAVFRHWSPPARVRARWAGARRGGLGAARQPRRQHGAGVGWPFRAGGERPA